MSVRVTESQVKEIIPTNSDVQIFIDVASRLIDEVFATTELSADRLTDIELYLSAHLVALTEEGGGVVAQRIGSTSVQYAQLRGDNLKLTRFGQIALALDTTGVLASSAKEKARFQGFGP